MHINSRSTIGGGLGYPRVMTTDWTAFDRLLASRRRAIVLGFVEFLRLNSVSQEPDKVRATGQWLAAEMEARGLEGRLLETGGNPAVFGERRVPGATRRLAEDGAPPVALAGVADTELGGLLCHARGASDDKGPIWCHLHAMELMDALGSGRRST